MTRTLMLVRAPYQQALLLAAAIGFTAGCAQAAHLALLAYNPGSEQEDSGSEQIDSPFLNFRDNELCYDNYKPGWRGGYTSPNNELDVDAPMDQTVRNLMCSGHPRNQLYAKLYERMDVHNVDDFTIALMVVTCVGEGACESNEGREVARSGTTGRHFRLSYAVTSDLYPYALRLDREKVASVVARLNVPETLKSAFLRRVTASQQHMINLVKGWNPRFHQIYIVTAKETMARRAAEERALASYYNRFERIRNQLDVALLDRKTSKKLLRTARTLRDEYVAACVQQGRTVMYCVTGPVGRPLTSYLVRIAVALGDIPSAVAEHTLLNTGPNQVDVRFEIHEAVGRAMRKEVATYSRYQEGVAMGLDSSLLAKRFGDPPPVDLSEWGNGAGLTPSREWAYEDQIREVRDQVGYVRREVSQVRRKGKMAVISFRDVVKSYREQAHCKETNRVDEITRSGEVRYRVECYGPWVKRVDRDKEKPVTVPAIEARHLRPGQLVMLTIDRATRHGAVVRAFPSTKRGVSPSQLRGFPVTTPR